VVCSTEGKEASYHYGLNPGRGAWRGEALFEIIREYGRELQRERDSPKRELPRNRIKLTNGEGS